MTTRRHVLGALAALGLPAVPGWAAAGNARYLSAARTGPDRYALIGLTASGDRAFAVPLPGRGHAAAAHPTRPEAVAFARRPGRFALVLDCRSGDVLHQLDSPPGRHFYGHGAFSAHGDLLFTTENDYETATGMIGVWDSRSYRRIAEFPSGGVGPHEMRLMPGGRQLVVANGGIETHPDSGRSKLNLPTMAPNLSYFSLSGTPEATAALPPQLHKSSLRHLAVDHSGQVAVACQWQGPEADSPALLALHRPGAELRLAEFPPGLARRMQGYAGSIAISRDGQQIALTGPRGGLAALFTGDGTYLRSLHHADVCGVAPARTGFWLTTGTGQVLHSEHPEQGQANALAWDNHLVEIGA